MNLLGALIRNAAAEFPVGLYPQCVKLFRVGVNHHSVGSHGWFPPFRVQKVPGGPSVEVSRAREERLIVEQGLAETLKSMDG